MYRVQISLPDNEQLLGELESMLKWLYTRRLEPKTIRYTYLPRLITARLDFNREAEAAEFARKFDGELSPA